MNRTKIEWVKNPDSSQGYTWNPITGCLNGCPYCYARKLANGRLRERYLANSNVADISNRLRDPNSSLWDKVITDPFYPRFWEERLSDPYSYGRNFSDSGYKMHHHKGIFVCDMGELFGDWVPIEWQEKIFGVIKTCPQHRFYLLTKQPQNLIKFSPFPENCWVGVTATDYEQYWNAIQGLCRIDAKVKYISFEPLLRPIPIMLEPFRIRAINWSIIGAQTNPLKRPHPSWVKEITEAALQASITIFHKDNLKDVGILRIRLSDDQFKEVYGVDFRQELPK